MKERRTRKLIVGNWKMNQTAQDIDSFFEDLKGHDCLYGVAPQSIHLGKIASLKEQHPNLLLGTQNIGPSESGAFTGETSILSAMDFGINFSLVGHSERRDIYKETNQDLTKKISLCFKHNIEAIFCIGEQLSERESNQTEEVLKAQLRDVLLNLDNPNWDLLTIAYEPVWAIGTGKVATPEQAQSAHAFIRNELREICSTEVADSLHILYGGSVKPSNIKDLISAPDIDGALVGGASLKADSFNALCTD